MTGACVLWRGETRSGYGLITFPRESGKRVRVYAHRAFFMAYKGPIPRGCQVHHVCGTRLCVNPAHLEAVTPREHHDHHQSVWGAIAARVAVVTARRTCVHGHEYDDANTYYDRRGHRRCRACNREACRVRRATA